MTKSKHKTFNFVDKQINPEHNKDCKCKPKCSISKEANKNTVVYHGGKSHPLGTPCKFCEKVKKGFEKSEFNEVSKETWKERLRNFCGVIASRSGIYLKENDVKQFISTELACARQEEQVKEICICAAVKTNTGKIFRGHRHGDCLGAIHDRHFVASNESDDQGFITSRNKYVTREEGIKLQLTANIESANPSGYESYLFSEDLY